MKKRPGRKGLTPYARMAKWIRDGRIVEGDGGCWLWRGSLSSNGYGHVAMTDKVVGGDGSGRVRAAVHRWVYELHVGEIPAGLDLDHLCRVRHCCNPWHLEPVTRSVNLRRAVGIGIQWSSRSRCSAGHEYTDENTARDARGHRVCRACRRRYSAEHARKRRARRDR